MPRDHRLYLDNILESISRIFSYIERMDFDGFAADQKTVDAVVRNLEIIGEAARNLSDEIKQSLTEVEWKKIVGMRNILAHEYFGINNQIIWDIVQTKLPPLKKACEEGLKDDNK